MAPKRRRVEDEEEICRKKANMIRKDTLRSQTAHKQQNELANKKTRRRVRMADKRRNESSEKSADRKARDRSSKAEERLNESPEKSADRKARDRSSTAEERRNESPEKSADRKARDRSSKAEERLNESPEKSTNRKARGRSSKAEERRNESPEKSADRKTRERSRKAKSKTALGGVGVCHPYEFSDNYVMPHTLSCMNRKCFSCGSFMFKDECHKGKLGMNAKFSLCCSYGSLILPKQPDPPTALKNLLTLNTPQSRSFRDNIRAYNSALALASLGISGEEYKFSGHGPFCFRVSGQVYHSVGHLLPDKQDTPKFSQLYIYDTKNELDNRMKCFDGLDRCIMGQLQEMMHQHNVHVHAYKQVSDMLQVVPSPDVSLVLKASGTIDPRRYNVPTGTDVAAIVPLYGKDNPQAGHSRRDVRVYMNRSQHPGGYYTQRISELHQLYDPLMYVLLFPYGNLGWNPEMTIGGKKVTPMMYYRHQIIFREEDGQSFNILLRSGRLFQQYLVDMYMKVEGLRLNYIRHNQSKLRVEMYKGLCDAINSSDVNIPSGSDIGRKLILPSSFVGSPRYQHQLFQDAMAIVRRYGKPDYFLTFTCNPNWPEIKDNLLSGQTPNDRPDLMVRVFCLKLRALLHDLFDKHVLGKVIGSVHVIEYQKRGPPHAHMLMIMDPADKPRTPEEIDDRIWAIIPDKDTNPQLYQVVSRMMLHGPCGLANPKCPCMVDGKCSKDFPKKFTDHTMENADGYPNYRRPDDGRVVEKSRFPLDNRHVVPYNPYLTQKFNAHINVEICGSVSSVKYLYKYVYKGPDMAQVALESPDTPIDEIRRYVNSRFITATEACWRLFGFDTHGRQPTIVRLAVHEEDMQTVVFDEDDMTGAVEEVKKTTLVAWFALNQADNDARTYMYHQIPEHYTWNSTRQTWCKRKSGKCIGRMYSTNPAQGERHYLRLLLHHVPGATCFDDLKKAENGTICKTFKEKAMLMGLLDDDTEWKSCLNEALLNCMPIQLRSLFAIILVYCNPSEPAVLWNAFKNDMSQDISHMAEQSLGQDQMTPEVEDAIINQVLIKLQEELEMMNSSLDKYGLPLPNYDNTIQTEPKVIQDQLFNQTEQQEKGAVMTGRLNEQQALMLTTVMQSVSNPDEEKRVFFISGPGGCGKTFLFETILASVRGEGKIALAVAASGIAAELLEGGRTAHSQFHIPIPINECSVLNISAQSKDAELLRRTALILWDEVMMSHRHQIECLDRSLQDILKKPGIPFGGITVVFGGDPMQILPVVRHGSASHIIDACVISSTLLEHFTMMKLTKNMRVEPDEIEFAQYVLSIGTGSEQTHPQQGDDMIKIPQQYLVSSTEDLINHVFPHIDDETGIQPLYYASRAILTPKNEDVDELNNTILSRCCGQSRTYLSADSIVDDESDSHYPVDFLNSLTLSGMSPHSLTLKVGSPVILLRNLKGLGLKNGTRMIVTKLGDRVIETEICVGQAKGMRVLLPRINLQPSDTEMPFVLRRRQFPVKLCYVMTINKSQGQTLDVVGIYLPNAVFSHGQLYVSFSRARTSSGVVVYVDNDDGYTRNIVYRQLLC